MKRLTENKYGFWRGLHRYAYYKIIIPIKREKRSPKYTARGTVVGIFFGLAPVIFQMNLVFLVWLAARRLKWNFSLPAGLAWTWISNIFTSVPLLYLYYVTGRFLLGEGSGNYADFAAMFHNGVWEGIRTAAVKLGGSIALGSVIYITAGTALGYAVSYKYLTYKKRRERAKHEKAAQT